ncbi:AGAP013097-PA-like protein [Anopheles sinensis]|uniref:AGAP013097-PA-like protein n=1 Tax=Anopheles sinensis TaxID=74873 RepID=A0A084WFE7_ANOSI|nr:AGAP013097-PA-like protein [Anopheles sinensis]
MSLDLANCLMTFVWIVTLMATVDGELPEVSEPTSSEQAGGGWQCQRPGRFSNPDDPSCRTYLTCIPDLQSRDAEPTFTQRLDECGSNALFSARYQRCITGTDCETLEDFYAIEYECAECGKFVLPTSTDCRHFVNCLKTKDPGVFVPIRQGCPAGKLFSPEGRGCVAEDTFECSPGTTAVSPVLLVTTTPPPTAASIAEARGGHLSDFVCLGPGRFPDESVPHCRGFRWCTALEGGTVGQFVSRNFLCDPGQVFSELEERCVPTGSYQCPDDDDGGGGADRFRCVAVGRFPDRSTPGCVRYYHCQETAGGTLKALLERCPTGTVFSWLTTRCVPTAEYVCPVVEVIQDQVEETILAPRAEGRQQVEDPPNEPESSNGGTISRQHRSRCSRSGRFGNDADALCRTYYICTRDIRGAWAKVLVRCPAGTIFSRTAARCVGAESVEPDDPCAPRKKSTPISTSTRDYEPEDPDISVGSAEDMTCGESDLVLPNPADRTCRTYFRCRETVTSGGLRTPRLQLFTCPEDTLFSTIAGRCVPLRVRADTDQDDASGQDIFQPGVDDEPLLPDHCTEVDLGSGEPPDTIDPWLSTSTTAAELQPTTTMTSSTNQPTTLANVPTATPKATQASPMVDVGEAGRLGTYSGPAPEYPCTATGRFADINSVDCRSYFLCKQQQSSGSLVSVHLTCPDGTVFSRNLNKCIVSSRHVC